MEIFHHNWSKPKAVDHLFKIIQQKGEIMRKHVVRYKYVVRSKIKTAVSSSRPSLGDLPIAKRFDDYIT